jgi:3-phenylpropionate/trans-cinnamate dioxygenase ferredoxin reductase subunit
MGRVVDSSVAKAIVATHQNRGVKFVLAAEIVGISAAGGQADVELRDGRKISADLVIVGIGSIPNTELAREAGLSCDDGVVVDAFGRTSDPSIYAVGDVTRHFNPLLERSLRLESWQNAQNQGIAVAKAIAGALEPYAELPWFWTDQYDTNLQMVGAPASWDRVIWRGDPNSGKFTALYMLADRVVAGNTLNNARDVRFLKQLILAGEATDAAILADTSRSLAQIIKEQESR